MKKVTIGLLLLLLLLIAGYSFWWYQVASKAEEQAALLIDAFNEDMTHPFLLEYSSLSKAGYPFDVALQLSNPRLSLKKKQANDMALTLDGEASVSRSLWGNAFWIQSRGKTTLQVERLFKLVTQGKTEASFIGPVEELLKDWMNGSLTPARVAQLLSWRSAAAEWQEIDFVTHSSSQPSNDSLPLHLTAGKSGWLVDRSDLSSQKVFFEGKEKVEREKIDVEFKFQDISFNHDFKKEKKEEQSESKTSFSEHLSQQLFSWSDYDKMKFEGKGSIGYLLPDLSHKIFLAPLAGKSSGIDLDIEKLFITTAVVSHRLEKLHFSLIQEGMDYALLYKWGDQETLYTPEYDQLLQTRLEAFWSNPSNLTSLFDADEEMIREVSKHSQSLATALNPNFGRWGPLSSKGEFSLNAQLLPQLKVNSEIKTFDFSVAQFFFKLVGQADWVNQQLSITGRIGHYEQLIELLAAYINRVVAAIDEIKLENLPLLPHLESEDLNDFKAFLKDISDLGADQGVLSITVIFDGPSRVYLSDKPIDEVSDLWQEMMMKILQRKQVELLAFEGLIDEEAEEAM